MGNAAKIPSISVGTVRAKNRSIRYKVDIPAMNGKKRARKFFENPSDAEIYAAKKRLEFAQTKDVTTTDTASGDRLGKGIRDYLNSKATKVGPESLRLMRNHLAKLEKRFPGLAPDDVPPFAAHRWLETVKCSQRTRYGIFSDCRTFYRWMLRYGFASTNPFDRMEPISSGESPKEILSVSEMKAVLKACDDRPGYIRAWVVLSGFAGLRTVEVMRMDWSCVNLEAGEIHVPRTASKKSKKGVRERYVAIVDALRRVIGDVPPSGKIIPVAKTTFHDQVANLRKAIHRKRWPHDCLRHSYASYYLAEHESAEKTAHQLGHTSSKMVHKHYAAAVKKAEAAKWWAIGLPE